CRPLSGRHWPEKRTLGGTKSLQTTLFKQALRICILFGYVLIFLLRPAAMPLAATEKELGGGFAADLICGRLQLELPGRACGPSALVRIFNTVGLIKRRLGNEVRVGWFFCFDLYFVFRSQSQKRNTDRA
ncbi:MAG TPA: hypothetical protein VFU22_29665, partial [Roseiflexaceae bacterium]|nr:hypothetical protein [Roseiflexaceae bacterium]